MDKLQAKVKSYKRQAEEAVSKEVPAYLVTQWGVLMRPEWEPLPDQNYSESPRSDLAPADHTQKHPPFLLP